VPGPPKLEVDVYRGCVVHRVRDPRSTFGAAGVEAGMELIDVNGRDVTDLPFDDIVAQVFATHYQATQESETVRAFLRLRFRRARHPEDGGGDDDDEGDDGDEGDHQQASDRRGDDGDDGDYDDDDDGGGGDDDDDGGQQQQQNKQQRQKQQVQRQQQRQLQRQQQLGHAPLVKLLEFEEFVSVCSILSPMASMEEKAAFVARLLDEDNDGYVSYENAFRFLKVP
jgi:hypothetical protein